LLDSESLKIGLLIKQIDEERQFNSDLKAELSESKEKADYLESVSMHEAHSQHARNNIFFSKSLRDANEKYSQIEDQSLDLKRKSDELKRLHSVWIMA
jgi:hypothetical protein